MSKYNVLTTCMIFLFVWIIKIIWITVRLLKCLVILTFIIDFVIIKFKEIRTLYAFFKNYYFPRSNSEGQG